MKKRVKASDIYVGIGIFLLILVIIIGILISLPSDTVDFSGTVKSVSYDSSDGCTYIEAEGTFGGTLTVKVSRGISVKDGAGEKYDISLIKPGDGILFDYADHGEDSDVVTAKWLKVLPSSSTEKEES